MAKVLIGTGLLLLAAGLLWPWLSKIGPGRLPGDLVLRREGVTVYVPIVTSLVLSVLLTLILWLLRR